jgi:peptidoglycan LD-endopeptidase CwlK
MEQETKVWDKISESRIEKLHPLVRNLARKLINTAENEGIMLRVTSTLRTFEEQNKLYAQGRTTAGKIVTNAKAGFSIHNFGLALDVVEIVEGKAIWNSPNWLQIGGIGKSLGFVWGGDWKKLVDKPHFEMTFGKTVTQLREMYFNGEIQDGYLKFN